MRQVSENAYNPISNPIDYKMDIRNKYIMGEIMKTTINNYNSLKWYFFTKNSPKSRINQKIILVIFLSSLSYFDREPKPKPMSKTSAIKSRTLVEKALGGS